MDNPGTQPQPQESFVKQSINNWLNIYMDAKQTFFFNATKEGDKEAEDQTALSFKTLLVCVHTLLELSKADNRNMLSDILALQRILERLDVLKELDAKTIEQIREICATVDSEFLYTYLSTLKPQINI